MALSFATPRAVKIAIAIQLASLMSLLTYIYWYHWPFPALAGTLFAAAGLAGTLALIRENGVSRRQAPAISRSILPA